MREKDAEKADAYRICEKVAEQDEDRRPCVRKLLAGTSGLSGCSSTEELKQTVLAAGNSPVNMYERRKHK